MAWYAISDLHLSSKVARLNEGFTRFVASLSKGDRLYILGDLFNFFVGLDLEDEGQKVVHGALADAKERGVKCFFIIGNRDFLVNKKEAASFNMELLSPETAITITKEDVLEPETCELHDLENPISKLLKPYLKQGEDMHDLSINKANLSSNSSLHTSEGHAHSLASPSSLYALDALTSAPVDPASSAAKSSAASAPEIRGSFAPKDSAVSVSLSSDNGFLEQNHTDVLCMEHDKFLDLSAIRVLKNNKNICANYKENCANCKEIFAHDAVVAIEDVYSTAENEIHLLLSHGDLFCVNDTGYMRYQKLVRNPLIQALFRLLPKSTKRKIAANIREQSANTDRSSYDPLIYGVEERAVDKAFTCLFEGKEKRAIATEDKHAMNKAVNISVHGHIHDFSVYYKCGGASRASVRKADDSCFSYEDAFHDECTPSGKAASKASCETSCNASSEASGKVSCKTIGEARYVLGFWGENFSFIKISAEAKGMSQTAKGEVKVGFYQLPLEIL